MLWWRILSDNLVSSYSRLRCKNKTIFVGNDVWTGAKSIFLPGIRIGDGAIIGAGSVVTKDVPPYCIVAGTPAKLVRMRFNPKLIKLLLKIKWWYWSIDKIKRNKRFFSSDLTHLKVEEISELIVP
jgi:tetrahydrodipicolinate N-succinyltransferase